MHIPDKYRDRYDRLAASHPWMREMRDEHSELENTPFCEQVDMWLHGKAPMECKTCPDGKYAELVKDEPTNGIDGETNGIGDGITLPDGDVVAMLRKYANFWSLSHETYTQCDPDWEKTTMRVLADMVERDYVLRTTYNAVCADRRRWFDRFNELQGEVEKLTAERDELEGKLSELLCTLTNGKWSKSSYSVKDMIAMVYDEQEREVDEAVAEVREEWEAERDRLRAERDEALEIRDKACGDAAGFKAERDELKKRVDEQQETLNNDCRDLIENDNEICKLAAERDDLKRKLEILKAHGVEIVDAVAGGFEIYNEAIRERDEWKAKCEQAQESYLDAKDARDMWHERYVTAERAMNKAAGNWARADRENAELTAKVDEQSELIAARGKMIETLEHMLSEKKAKYREVREQMLDYQRRIKAERDQYRELYEAAMSTDYAQAARERDAMNEQIEQIRSIIDEALHDRLTHE